MGSRGRKRYNAATALRKRDPAINPAALKRAQEQPPQPRRITPANPKAVPKAVPRVRSRRRGG
jgi:hypothetical protein